MMMTERGMIAPAASGSVLAQFDDILAAGRARTRRARPGREVRRGTNRLDVVPDAPAYRTQLRWKAPKLITTANETVSGANVRTVHILAPAPMKAGPAAADAAPQATVPAVTVERRTPPEGYRRAIKAHRQAARPSLADPDIAEAVERQTAAM
ncbi:hypothetical protein [Streptomyces griseofuscus]|uniref:hypothetical protein n=1 Tax=Streptomyces griseofuscus TaxID=146922 RepID=UPI0036C140E4